MTKQIDFSTAKTNLGPVHAAYEGAHMVWFGFGDDVSYMQSRMKGAVTWQENIDVKRRIATALNDFEENKPIDIKLYGTAFQNEVWQILSGIPKGHVVTYGDVAAKISDKGYARAVGTAVGQNPISLFIPCHRVVPAGKKDIGNYLWGADVKRMLLQNEGVNI